MWFFTFICFLILNLHNPIARCDAKRLPSQAGDAAVEVVGVGGSFVDVGGNSASPDGVPPWGIVLICVGILIVIVAIVFLVRWVRSGTDDDNSSTTEKKDSNQNLPTAVSDNIPIGLTDSSRTAASNLPAVEPTNQLTEPTDM